MQYRLVTDLENIENKRILVRVDLNVPIENNCIEDDFRLCAIQPTIDYLLTKKCVITLITHIGSAAHAAAFSTQLLVPWFEKHHYPIIFAADIATAYKKSLENRPTLILLENIRHWPEEFSLDVAFAKQLATLGDYFVQDAFGTLHKAETSIIILPRCFAYTQRAIGLCVARECTVFDNLHHHLTRPFLCILGGNKSAEKLTFIEALLPMADKILLAPALVFNFLQAQDSSVGSSLVDKDAVNTCRAIIKKATDQQVVNRFLYPTDYVVSTSDTYDDLHVISAHAFLPSDKGITIGPATTQQFVHQIEQAQTILLNGAFGFIEHPKTMVPLRTCIDGMNRAKNKTTIIAGGDSVAVARTQASEHITHLSTGGGAAIAYIAHKNLPGLHALNASKIP